MPPDQLIEHQGSRGGGSQRLAWVGQAIGDPVKPLAATRQIRGFRFRKHELLEKPQKPRETPLGSGGSFLTLSRDALQNGHREHRAKISPVDASTCVGLQGDSTGIVTIRKLTSEQSVTNRTEGGRTLRRCPIQSICEPGFGEGQPIESGQDLRYRTACLPGGEVCLQGLISDDFVRPFP